MWLGLTFKIVRVLVLSLTWLSFPLVRFTGTTVAVEVVSDDGDMVVIVIAVIVSVCNAAFTDKWQSNYLQSNGFFF